MFKFFDVILALLDTVVSFVVNTILTVLYAIKFILKGVLYAFSCLAYLPPWILAFVTAVIAFSVIMFIINRQ